MRPAFASAALTLTLLVTATTYAISPEKGRVVQGQYLGKGNAAIAGVKVQYGPSKVRITNTGRIIGHISKTVLVGGAPVANLSLKIHGRVTSLKQQKGSFSAPATVRISDGTTFRGTLHGLVDKSQRLSRYFRGKIKGASNSNFVLRAR